MSKSCCLCKTVESKYIPILCCGACQSVLYCSKVCQKEDWKAHKKICKSLNVGDGAMQVRIPVHMKNAAEAEANFEEIEQTLDEDCKQFFKLFTESTFEGRQAAARKMKKIARRLSKNNRKCLLFHSFYLLIHADSEKILWPNSPLLVLLQFVDPNVLKRDEHDEVRDTPLAHLAKMADPRDYSTLENQVPLGRQLIERGAIVDAVTYPNGDTPLHLACHSYNTTNLDFIQVLLEKGADPNAQNFLGETPLMFTVTMAPGAAKFLLEWPTTNINLTTKCGESFLARARWAVKYCSDEVALPDNPDRVTDQFVLLQWREIEETLVERGANDSGITTVDESRVPVR
jgi:hypothetical protein